MNNGWVRLYRKTINNPLLKGNMLALWATLLMLATHEKREEMFYGEVIGLLPGQLITGRKYLADRSGYSESGVEKALTRLKKEQQIEQQKSNKSRLITIINWDAYQQKEQQKEQQSNNRVTTKEQQSDTYKNEKNVKNEKKHTESSKEDSSTELMAIPLKKDFEEFVTLYEKGWKTKLKIRTERWKKYQARRKVFTKDEILEAMRNIYHDKFLQGDNEGGKIYGDIDYILRNDKIIEKYHSNPK